MKEVIYNFLKCFSKVGLFFKRLAVKIRSFRRFTQLVMKHSTLKGLFNDPNFVQLVFDMYVELKD